MSETESTQFQVTMRAAALRNGIRDALLFVGRDETLPMLLGMWLDWDGTTLTATGTDRFYIGRTTFRDISVNQTTEAWRTFLPYVGARAIVGALRAVPHTDNVRVVVSNGDLTVATEGLALTARLNTTVQDPGVQSLLNKYLAAEPAADAGSAALNAFRLARFSKVSRDFEEPNRVRILGTTDPVVVQIGDHFEGLVMPVRLNNPSTVAAPRKRAQSCGDCDGPCGDCERATAPSTPETAA